MTLAVTLTIEEFSAVVAAQVRKELALVALSAAKEVLTLAETAELLERHPKVVMNSLVKEKALPVHFISEREPRFKRAEVLAWLDTLPTKSKET